MPHNPVRHAAVRGRQCPLVCLLSDASLCCFKQNHYQHVRLVILKIHLKTYELTVSLCRALIPHYIWLPCHHSYSAVYSGAETNVLGIIYFSIYYHIFPKLSFSCRCVTGSTLSWPWTLQCCCVTLVCLCFRTWWRQLPATMWGWCYPLSCLLQTERCSRTCCPRWQISGFRSVCCRICNSTAHVLTLPGEQKRKGPIYIYTPFIFMLFF